MYHITNILVFVKTMISLQYNISIASNYDPMIQIFEATKCERTNPGVK